MFYDFIYFGSDRTEFNWILMAISFVSIRFVSVTQRCISVFHLHGKITRGTFMSALLEAVLLFVHITLVK